jgi:hypothetical protein
MLSAVVYVVVRRTTTRDNERQHEQHKTTKTILFKILKKILIDFERSDPPKKSGSQKVIPKATKRTKNYENASGAAIT